MIKITEPVELSIRLILLNTTILYYSFSDPNSLALYFSDSSREWFQRSGAIVVAISIVIEFIILKFLQYMNDDQAEKQCVMDKFSRQGTFEGHLESLSDSIVEGQHSLKASHKVSIIVIHINLFIGTVIWGYGDLIYKAFN